MPDLLLKRLYCIIATRFISHGPSHIINLSTRSEKVLLDFNSQVLKERWEDHQKHVLEKVFDRQQKAQERKEKLAQEINQWSTQNDKLQFELVSLKKVTMRSSKESTFWT